MDGPAGSAPWCKQSTSKGELVQRGRYNHAAFKNPFHCSDGDSKACW
jgi:hypothetical protein